MDRVLIALLSLPAQIPTYEVASVKLDNSGTGHSSTNTSKGRIAITNHTLKSLVERAYGVKPFQVACPEWMENVRVDITATYPAETKREDRPLMLRSLLEERFKLSAHRVSKEVQGLVLLPAKAGFKLAPVESGGSSMSSNGGSVRTLTSKKVAMEELADFLGRELDETVLDRTGIAGVYDFELRWAHGEQKDDSAPSIFTALQESPGLRLKPEKVPLEMIVVDRMERASTEN
jgi:uncharacterized protein (TIGR03435 family)